MSNVINASHKVWDGSIPFSTFYNQLGLSALSNQIFVTLSGSGHTIDDNSSVMYTNLDKLWFWGRELPGSTGIMEPIIINDGATSDAPFHLFKNINLYVHTTSSPFISNSTSKRALYMYIGQDCIVQDEGLEDIVFCYINYDSASISVQNYGDISFGAADSYFVNNNIGGCIIDNFMEGSIDTDSLASSVDPLASVQIKFSMGYPETRPTFPNVLGSLTQYTQNYSKNVYYNPTLSGLSATNVQDAIDEMLAEMSGALVWDGASSFGEFYVANNIGSLDKTVNVTLKGTGHTIDTTNMPVGGFANCEYLRFVGEIKEGSTVTSEDDVLFETGLPHLLSDVSWNNNNTTTVMFAATSYQRWLIGQRCSINNGGGALAFMSLI